MPFVQDPCPAPADQSKLSDIAASASGRIAAVGFERTYIVGGSPGMPLILEKTAADGFWSALDSPNLGFTWHDLEVVHYLPGHPEEDFVAVGWYLPDNSVAHPDGMLLRYHRATDSWDLETFDDPTVDYIAISDAVFDPFDPNRLLICGTRVFSDPYGSCFEFWPLVVSFHLDTLTYEILPFTTRGDLKSIVALRDGRFLAFGAATGECDYLGVPIAFLIDGQTTTVIPNPPPWPGHPHYQFNDATTLDDGRALVVGLGSALGGSFYVTLGYRYDPADASWEVFKPIDPDSTDYPPGYKNQLWGVAPGPDGRTYAVGRYHYINAEGLHYYHALIESFDGTSWRLEDTPPEFHDSWTTQLWNVCAHPTAGMWAAGWSWDPDDHAHYWHDRALVMRQSEATTSVEPATVATPLKCEALPNPFTESTSIRLAPAPMDDLSITIHDVSG